MHGQDLLEETLDSILHSIVRSKLKLPSADEGEVTSLAQWVDWLIWLGQWLRAQAAMEGQRLAVVRVPSRKLTSAFVALGSIFSSVKLSKNLISWDSLINLKSNTEVFWQETKDGKVKSFAGRFVKATELEGNDVLEVFVDAKGRTKSETRFFSRSIAMSYGVSPSQSIVAMGKQLDELRKFVKEISNDAWQGSISSDDAETTIITDTKSFLSDAWEVPIYFDGGGRISLLDALHINVKERNLGKTRLVSSRTGMGVHPGTKLTIFDGSNALLRKTDSMANSNLIILEYSECDEEVIQRLRGIYDYSQDRAVYLPPEGVLPLPPRFECHVFGLPTN